MKVILFGATGMIGQGALRECLLDPDVERVLAVGRSAASKGAQKHEFKGYDACFFCLGVASAGMSEAEYRRVTSSAR